MTLNSLGAGLHGPWAELVQIQADVWRHFSVACPRLPFLSPLRTSRNFNKMPEPGWTLESAPVSPEYSKGL